MSSQSESFLQNFHQKHPSCSSNAFPSGKAENGMNSYELLVDLFKNDDSYLLDLACGDGYLLDLFAKARGGSSEKLFGIDMSIGELSVAWQLESLKTPQVLLGNARALPFAPNIFKGVTCHMALMLMPDVQEVLGEIHRSLAPGGQFVAILPGERIADEPTQIYREWLRQNIPADKLASLQSLGDNRVRSAESLRSLFAEFSKFQLETFRITYQLNPEKLSEIFQTLYASGLLTEEQRTKMAKDLLESFHKLGAKEIQHAYQIYRLVAQK